MSSELNIKILINPEVKSAYFSEYLKVAQSELLLRVGPKEVKHECIGGMDFLTLKVFEDEISKILNLSFVYGVFEEHDSSLIPIDQKANFYLHADFIFGSKFKGKTNERLTQLMLNNICSIVNKEKPKILDPMCGRGTSLFWALAYGLKAKGIEKDLRSIEDIQRNVKKWNKLRNAKLKFEEGFVSTKNKAGVGKYFMMSSPESHYKHVIGDSKDCVELLSGEKFDGILTDLPYGVQHFGGNGDRSPLQDLQDSIPEWMKLLNHGGAVVISFNANLPKKKDLLPLFQDQGLQQIAFDGEHRVSESILRDVLIFQKK